MDIISILMISNLAIGFMFILENFIDNMIRRNNKLLITFLKTLITTMKINSHTKYRMLYEDIAEYALINNCTLSRGW